MNRATCTVVVAAAMLGVLGIAPHTAALAHLVGKPAPKITNSTWIHSKPLRLADLRGKVVLLEFWTYGCINCRNTIPSLVDWHKKYGPEGLVVIGIHSPEFPWERPLEKVTEACTNLGITFPVALDNDFATWKRYGTRYWPTLHLIDKNGIIRHTRFGEGGYAQMEAMIHRLLEE